MSGTTFEQLGPNVVVRAGAGAGKTTELVERVLRLAQTSLDKYQRLPNLVVTTFTRKATGELRERLMKKALEIGDERLVQFVQNESQLHISTIHGVLGLFLSRYGGSIGLAPQYKIIEEPKEKQNFRRILRQVLRTDTHEASQFEKALEEMGLHILEEALRSYVEIRISKGMPSFASQSELEQMAKQELVEWRQQAKDLVSRLESSEAEKSDAWKTYRALLSQVLAREASDYVTQLAKIEEFLEQKPAARFSKGADIETRELRSRVQEIAADFSQYRFNPESWEKHSEVCCAFQDLAEVLFEMVLQSKIRSSELTMNDLEVFSLYLVRENPKAAELFSKDWDYWLIDEYQDTSPRQVALLKALVGDRNSFVVGDPQQSIYLFRGARCEVFAERSEEVERRGGEFSRKMINYRSRPELLEYFNDVFSNLSSQFEPMQAGRESIAELKEVPAAVYWNTDDESGASSARAVELIEQGVLPEQICILARTNHELEKIAYLAQASGIPYQVHASSLFFERRETRDALALLRFLINPSDNKNLISLLRSPWFKMQDGEIAAITKSAGKVFWQSFAKHCPELAAVLDHAEVVGYSNAWKQALINMGIFDFCQTQDPSGRREANLWKLISLLATQERSPGFSVSQFTEDHMHGEDLKSGDATPVIEPKRVSLMTIHASKGLQFDYIILPGVGKAPTPTQLDHIAWSEDFSKFTLKIQDPGGAGSVSSLHGEVIRKARREQELKEHERLLYVALTRARFGVTLIWNKASESSWAARLSQRGAEIFTHSPSSYSAKITPVQDVTLLSRYEFPKLSTRATVSVTQVLSKPSDQPKPLEKVSEMLEKATSGIEVHRFLESIKYRRQSNLETMSEQQKKAFEFLKSWESGKLLEIIEQGQVEWGFTLIRGDELLQGQIDLWGQDGSGAYWVVDYKTGSLHYADKALEQLKIYADALLRMGQIPSGSFVTLAAVFPFSGRVISEKFTSS